MPEIEPPSLGEVLRRLDEVSRQLAAMMMEIKEDRADAARLYVPRELYRAERDAQNAIVADLHRDVGKVEVASLAAVKDVRTDMDTKFASIDADRKSDIAWKRQVLLGMAGLAVTTLLSIVFFVLNYAAGSS